MTTVPQQRRYTTGLKGRKASTYEGGIRAISLWQWPAVLAAPAKLSSIAAHIDVTPTLMEAAGVAPDDEMDGLSLLPVLSGEPAGPDDRSLFFQCHRGLTPKRYQNAAVRSGAYKLVLGSGAFSDEAWSFTGTPPTELYDLSTDPEEQKNIAEERPEIVEDLRARYEAWFEDCSKHALIRSGGHPHRVPGRDRVRPFAVSGFHVCRVAVRRHGRQ